MSVERRNGGSKKPKTKSAGNAAFREFATLAKMKPKDLWWGEVVISLLGAAGGAWLGHERPSEAYAAARVAAPLVSVIIGAVVAALAMITRALDTSFLKKSKAAGITPMSQYFSPFFNIVALGILSGISLILLAATSSCETNFRTAFGAAAGFFTLWTLAGLLPALGTLIQFTHLLESTAGIPDPK
ncbi:hypothetical protein ACIRL0_30485 [Streptomyces sp. NPDC102365]|uniref:hypothetical protein n=1 Tax=Streptomyces sp. NPDC102365 TaxID=3366162 RepID=UPI0037F50AF8